ncbi:MAG TPA: hypothetical protein ENH74_05775 [Methylophaga sp.]|nr:hypothetical protein [Methylophaga sp.]
MAKELTIIFPECESKVLKSYYLEHKKFGCQSESKNKVLDNIRPSTKTTKGKTPNTQKKGRKKKNKLMLISKRGTRIERKTECNLCHKEKSPVWHYTESSHGVVNICADCKPMLFDRSFGKKDALEYAKTGGAFEGNRRRH